MNKKVLAGFLGLFITCFSLTGMTQDTLVSPQGWHLLDKAKDGYYGISLDKAYDFLKSKKLKSSRVTVAVIDGGLDTMHEDLRPLIWVNPREIPGNGIDDDKNGYVDDKYGWNYLGGKNGESVMTDSDEGLRVYHRFKSKYAGKTINEKTLIPEEQVEYRMWKKAEGFIKGAAEGIDIVRIRTTYNNLTRSDSILSAAIGKTKYTGHELDSFLPRNEAERKAKEAIFGILKRNDALDASNQDLISNIKFFLDDGETKLANVTTPPVEYRKNVTGDDEYDFNARNYGTADVMAKRSQHGTHVAGIIGAIRNNNIGVKGVADNVNIIPLIVVPDGDEHDKDIALAIRYAVDNGAKVVNMSFGKSFSPGKQWIDDAVQYAAKKGVLLIHAAGNENKNLDAEGLESYPNPWFINGKSATNWITVGASGGGKMGPLAASFSNYGKKNVDVFAPGVSIYSTITGTNTYEMMQGTSMAAPVVTGIAALIKSYFPSLTPEQIKTVIEKSAVVYNEKTPVPGAGETDPEVYLKDISRTGGVVNAYNAVKLAYDMSKGGKPAKAVK